MALGISPSLFTMKQSTEKKTGYKTVQRAKQCFTDCPVLVAALSVVDPYCGQLPAGSHKVQTVEGSSCHGSYTSENLGKCGTNGLNSKTPEHPNTF